MPTGNLRKTLCAGLLVLVSMTTAAAQKTLRANNSAAIPTSILLRIVRCEDERRWDDDLRVLLAAKEAEVRKRAALAMGRIGDERAVPALIDLLKQDADQDVRQMAAFAIGEIESTAGSDALITVLDDTREPAAVRARAVEALGKIGAVLLSNSATSGPQGAQPRVEDKTLAQIRLAILDVLKFEAGRRSMPDRLTVLLGLTAALRARPEGASPVIISFLNYSDPRIVADALNTMARLRLKDGTDRVRQLLGHGEAIVRANAARVIGAAEDKGAYDKLLELALHDIDLRVRVSAIRALGGLKDARAADPLLVRGNSLLATAAKSRIARPVELNEILEIATVLGTLLRNTNSEKAVSWLREVGELVDATSPTIEISLARIAPHQYMSVGPFLTYDVAAQQVSLAQGLAEVALAKTGQPVLDSNIKDFVTNLAHGALVCPPPKPGIPPHPARIQPGMVIFGEGSCQSLQTVAVSDFLRAYAAVKPQDLETILRQRLNDRDVIIRGTAADLISEQPPNETNARALIETLPVALRDRDLNDAALSILDALAKQKSPAANDAIKTALDSSDHLIRRRAVALLKANGAGDFSNRIGTVQTRNTDADYRRALARSGRTVTATLVTSKGAFTIEFLPEQAPLTVDNFVQLARKGYFNGQTVPRVVPNFVIQTGDPRGDQNGGPGYQIRCEINETAYERGAVGMALSGKDTGGSQWFVTHSPQPHLDGGYTVFGRVIRGMEVVDSIARGDTIRRVIVNER
jgi:cyclophilin family peptidyl-prolyl cis-trans isomerase/HEAT repeat protein